MDARPPAPTESPNADRTRDDQPPPILGGWRALYALVIAGLLLMIVLCYGLNGLGR